jgi:hypothetical protein
MARKQSVKSSVKRVWAVGFVALLLVGGVSPLVGAQVPYVAAEAVGLAFTTAGQAAMGAEELSHYYLGSVKKQAVILVPAGTHEVIYGISPWEFRGNTTALVGVLVRDIADGGAHVLSDYTLFGPNGTFTQTVGSVFAVDDTTQQVLFRDVPPIPGVWNVTQVGSPVAIATFQLRGKGLLHSGDSASTAYDAALPPLVSEGLGGEDAPAGEPEILYPPRGPSDEADVIRQYLTNLRCPTDPAYSNDRGVLVDIESFGETEVTEHGAGFEPLVKMWKEYDVVY